MSRIVSGVLAALLPVLVACTDASSQIPEGLEGTLLVLNKGGNDVSIIDLASGRITATLPTGEGPHELVASSDGRWAVATNYQGGNSLTVIDIAGSRVARTVDLGRYRRPHGISFMPGDSLMAVTSEASRAVVFVRLADDEITGTIDTGQAGSHMLALVGDGSRIYTSNIQGDSVSELDVAKGELVRVLSVPPAPEAITVSADGTEVWVGSNDEGSVSVIHTTNGSTELVADGFGWPYRILITPDQRTVIVPDLRANVVRVFDRASREERWTPLVGQEKLLVKCIDSIGTS